MPKILVCGNDDTRESLKSILGDLYNLILTEDQGQCLDVLYHAKDISHLLIDYLVGDEFPQKIKKEYPALRIVLILDRKSTLKPKEILALGAHKPLSKPLLTDKVIASLK
mgnify:CR=1 FL=1